MTEEEIRKNIEADMLKFQNLRPQLLSNLPRLAGLSDREFIVFMQLARGARVTAIGPAMYLSYKTISTYRTRLLKKLAIHTNVQLMQYAWQAKLVEPEPVHV